MFAGFEFFSTLGTELQFGTVTPLLARAANVRRSSVVHFQAPELGEAASAARIWAVKPVLILSAFDPGCVFRALHSLNDNQVNSARALWPSNKTAMQPTSKDMDSARCYNVKQV